ncbi:MAG: lysophospholipase [Leptospirales bacterium]|nr:lysophospholipase [Leptospirales bacterium]
MYQQTDGILRSSKDDFELAYHRWLPQQTRRVMVVQHGFGEHSGRYGHLREALDGTGTAFYALDSRGHGKTGGKRGHVDQFQLYVDDLADLVQLARKENGENKVYLLGHSLGGVMALQYALEGTNQRNLHALIVSAPGLIVQLDFAKRIKKFLAQVFARVAPATTLDANLDLTYLSHDQSEIDAYKADPLVHGKVSFQMASNLFSLGKAIFKKASHLTVPAYVFQGTADGIVSPESSRRLYELLTTKDKTLKMYEGLFHETMNELPADRARVLGDLKAWLESH